MAYSLKDATTHMWNPVRGYPRNSPCYCKSGKKFKKCCYGKQALVVDRNEKAVNAAKTVAILKQVKAHQDARRR